MEKEFISQEQATKLKELGFKEPCMFWFDDGTPTYFTEFPLELPSNFNITHLISCPLKQQVFRWFRDNYNIQGYIQSCTVRGDKNGKKFSDYFLCINGIDMEFINSDARDMVDVTYEEAETKCIDELIRIVQSTSNEG